MWGGIIMMKKISIIISFISLCVAVALIVPRFGTTNETVEKP